MKNPGMAKARKIATAVVRIIILSWRMRGFDYVYYKTQAPGVKGRRKAREHYISKGTAEGLNPNRWFHTDYYTEKYPDVRYSGENPYMHYIMHGMYEGRMPNGSSIPAKKVMGRLRSLRRYYKVFGARNLARKILSGIGAGGAVSLAKWNLNQGSGIFVSFSQRHHRFKKKPLFSILVPAYGTNAGYFKQLLKSLLKQTYSNWELCIADAGNGGDLRKVLKPFKDKRIKYKRLDENKGIAGNTNEAFAMSSGDYLVLLDHDDFLARNALHEAALAINDEPEVDFIYSDRAMVDEPGKNITELIFLYGYSPDLLRCHNYPCHLSVFSRRITEEAGLWNPEFDGSQDYDLVLRVIERTDRVVHIPKILYFWRTCEGSVALDSKSKPYAYEAGIRAVTEHTERIGWPALVTFTEELLTYRTRYEIKGSPDVAVIIPNRDYAKGLEKCIESILSKTSYENYRIYIVENNSSEKETFELYKRLEKHKRIKIIVHPPGQFNFPSLNNLAVENTEEEYLILLNNDTSVISPDWMEEMLMFAQRDDVGAVGCMLYYDDDTIQHCGLEIGLGGWIASHHEHAKPRGSLGYLTVLCHPRNLNAVTGACMMISRKDYQAAGGMDEENLKVSFNDIDLCLRLREMGRLNVFTPHAELYHYEGKSRGNDLETRHLKRYMNECEFFRKKWKKYFDKPDMYGNPNTAKFIY